MDLLALLLAVAVVAAIVVRTSLAHTTIFDFERGVKFTRGVLKGELGPGKHWYAPGVSSIRKYDLRPAFLHVPGQEILTADGIPVKLTLALEYRVTDLVRAIRSSDAFLTALYTEAQLQVRNAVATLPVEELLTARATMGPALAAAAAPRAAALGVELLSLEVKDLTLPGELKRLFAQVVKAKQEGLATLEKARGETAALRNLANAAQMVERSPQLLQLRILQTVAQNPNNTVVLGMPPSGPLPLRDAGPRLPAADGGE